MARLRTNRELLGLGRASYNGAAVKIEQRPWHGLSYLAAYTFSKSIDQASTINVT